MYKYFYIAILLGGILLGVMTLLFDVIGKRYPKLWGSIQKCLMVTITVSTIGFIVTLMR